MTHAFKQKDREHAIFVGGTWDGIDSAGMLGPLYSQTNAFATFIDYPARYGDGMSYKESQREGMINLIDTIKDIIQGYNGKGEAKPAFFIYGYSQGAGIITLALKAMIHGNDPDLRFIKQVHLVANPNRQPGHITGWDPGGRGIAWKANDGWWGDMKNIVFEYCAPGDIIASADPEKTLLFRLPTYSDEFNATDPTTWAKGLRNGLATLDIKKMFPELSRTRGMVEYAKRWDTTYKALSRYILTGVHTKYQTMMMPNGQTCFEYIMDKSNTEGNVFLFNG